MHGIAHTAPEGREESRPPSSALEPAEAQLVVGTHALIVRPSRVRAARLVAIDEQHRFGVLQPRADGQGRSQATRRTVLVLTATPIPRTLLLTLYGT